MASFSKTDIKKIVIYALCTTPIPSDQDIIAWVKNNHIAFTQAFGGRGIMNDLSTTEDAIIELLAEKEDIMKGLKKEISACDEDEDGDGWIVDAHGQIRIHVDGAIYWDTRMNCRISIGGTSPRCRITDIGGREIGDCKGN